MDGLPDFIGKPVTKLGECLMIEDTPDNTVVECEVTAFEFGDPVIPLSVSHIQKAEIREYLDKDGLRFAGNLAVERMLG